MARSRLSPAASNSATMSLSLVASATNGTAVPPVFAISSATACNADSVLPATITLSPSAAKRLQSRAPSPRSGPTPITIAVFICRSPEVCGSGRRGRLGAVGQPRGIADRGAAGGDVAGDHRAGADLGEITDADI